VDLKKIYINHNQLQGHVLELIRQIHIDGWKPDYVVGITRGGLLPAVLISQYLSLPMHAIKVSLRDGQPDDCESKLWMAEDAVGYISFYDRTENVASNPADRKNILIVDDINDSGATIAWIKNDWQGGCLPNDAVWDDVWGNNVRVAVVVNNLASSQEVDYSSMEINKEEDPSWIVFPVENWWEIS